MGLVAWWMGDRGRTPGRYAAHRELLDRELHWRDVSSHRRRARCGGARQVNETSCAAPAFAFGVGLAILANTRPYEGAVLGITCAVFLLIRLVLLIRRSYESPSRLMRSVALPMALVLFPTFIWMGYYNYRVTVILADAV